MGLGEMPLSLALRHSFERTDQLRRCYGVLHDWLGFAPIRTPSRLLRREPGLRLHAFADASAGPALLIVPAPVKRAYIWDLEPEVSVVRRCLAHGLSVYLVEWTDEGTEGNLGLNYYADRLLLASVDAIAEETDEPYVVLAGHSLGGTLAAIFAALHPDRVRALVLLEAPMRFGAAAGVFAPLVATTSAGLIRDVFGAIPGSFLDVASAAASPRSFTGARWLDAIAVAGDGPRLRTHLRVERWTYDEFVLSGRLFEEVAERLYREDRFIRGSLMVDDRCATPQALDMPIFSVFRPHSLLVPPATILPLLAAAANSRNRSMRYDGEHGVALQHVGVLVGRRAHRRLWPEILDWIEACTA